MRINSQIIILWVILILMAVVFVASYRFSYFQARLGPLTISGLILILTVFQLVREYRRPQSHENGPEQKTLPSSNAESVRPYVIQSAWMIGFLLAIILFGFIVAIPLFGIAYMRSNGIKWHITLLIAALTTVVIYFLFAWALDVTLFPGVIYQILE
ncbi:MAG: tripartite tricarboxylate transporter TctB family protein [Deltaproteobacteria bacterium]|nr:tripartite tricarboxylate transporter TctB family protein [Deltaproteobacteria bacterium]